MVKGILGLVDDFAVMVDDIAPVCSRSMVVSVVPGFWWLYIALALNDSLPCCPLTKALPPRLLLPACTRTLPL